MSKLEQSHAARRARWRSLAQRKKPKIPPPVLAIATYLYILTPAALETTPTEKPKMPSSIDKLSQLSSMGAEAVGTLKGLLQTGCLDRYPNTRASVAELVAKWDAFFVIVDVSEVPK